MQIVPPPGDLLGGADGGIEGKEGGPGWQLLITATKPIQPKCPFSLIKNKSIYYIHTVEYYSTIKRNAVAWIDLKNMLSKKSQLQKATYAYISIYMKWFNIGISVEIENRFVVSRN